MKTNVILLLGSNLNGPLQFLIKAKDQIINKIGPVIKESSIYESEPWGFEDPNVFLNQVITVDSKLSASEILYIIHQIEESLGRKRNMRGGYKSRTIDIDILFFGDQVIENKELMIPHKLMHKRKFTLLPLQEIEPNMVHPVLNKTITELVNDCEDTSDVNRLNIS